MTGLRYQRHRGEHRQRERRGRPEGQCQPLPLQTHVPQRVSIALQPQAQVQSPRSQGEADEHRPLVQDIREDRVQERSRAHGCDFVPGPVWDRGQRAALASRCNCAGLRFAIPPDWPLSHGSTVAPHSQIG
jgi:hypothetical protein